MAHEHNPERAHDGSWGPYLKLFSMLALSFPFMYLAMWSNVWRLDHVYFNLTQVYMALVMVAPMAVLMLLLMWRMYPNKAANWIILGSSVVVFVAAVWLLRAQTFIGDEQYMRRMIPHHSQAINNSRRAVITNPELKELADHIIEAQEREISQMKAMLDRMDVTAVGTAVSEAREAYPLEPAGFGEIVAPPGYQVERVAEGLNYPVDITFADDGSIYLAEAGGHTYGTEPEQAPQARILRLSRDGKTEVVYDQGVPLEEIRNAGADDELPEGLIPPVTGVTWHKGKLYVAHRTRYSTVDPTGGELHTVIDRLPSWGFFHGGKPIFDADGKMVFFQSTQGNAGVIDRHWMKVINVFNKRDAHEIPGEDVTLTGENFAVPVEDPDTPDVEDKVLTGVYVPLGTQTEKGQVIKGQLICNGAFFRCDPDGSNIERIAWGLRSNFGYRFMPDGRLITTQNSGNPIPPREIHDDTEPVYEVKQGEWYGWPDYYSSEPVTLKKFGPHPIEHTFVLDDETRRRLLKGREKPLPPLAKLPSHSSAEGMVVGRSDFGIPDDEILVAEMGSIVPHTKKKMPGFKVQRVNLSTGGSTDFLTNRGGRPASSIEADGFERPIQLEWAPDGSLYVVDFGRIDFEKTGMTAHPGTGTVWRVTRAADAKPLQPVSGQFAVTGEHGHKQGH